VLATALHFGAHIDQIGELDLGYAPPYSSAIDVIAHVANTIQNKRSGLVKGISPIEVKAKIDRGDDFIFLDVRTQKEYDMERITDSRIKLVPLGRLRERYEELPQDKEIIAFCKVSLRAYEAACTLTEFGYENVKILDGGMLTWPYDNISSQ
jgi:rhodanese-related sulfurtransferase